MTERRKTPAGASRRFVDRDMPRRDQDAFK
jgi:hypothetical protein